LVLKDQSQYVDQPHEEVHGVEEATHAEPSIRNDRKHTTKADRLRLDVAQNVGAPTSQCRHRQSPDRFTRYMALMRKIIVTEPSSFQEAVHNPTWFDAMVEEYDSIFKNSAWEIVPRPVDKSMVGSRWIYKGKLLIIVLYLDDLILTGDEQLIHSCKEDLAKEFEMKDMGLLHYFLVLEIWQRDGQFFMFQGKYAREILGKFHMEGCKPMDTPLPGNWRKEDATSGEIMDDTVYQQLVGLLMYLVNTRPNIFYVVNQLSQVMVKPTKIFWKEGKHVLRYVRGTYEYGLWYR
jgi:hypothetical protein